MDCIFCRLAAGDIPSTKIYEDDRILAFLDLSPQAPIHFLVIPKAHISSMEEITAGNADVIGHMYAVIPGLMARQGAANGYRVVCNCGADGGQSVGHLHFHCLAGRELGWPPG